MGASVMSILANGIHQPSYLENQAGLNSLDQQQAQTALTKQQTAQEAIKAQQMQQQMQDSQAIRRAMIDHSGDAQVDPNAMLQTAFKYGMSGNGAQAFKSGVVDLQTKIAGLDEARHKVEQEHHQQAADYLAGYLQAPPEQQPTIWPTVRAQIIQRAQEMAQFLPEPGTAPTEKDLGAAIGGLKLFGTLLGQRKEQAAIEESKAKASQLTSQGQAEQATAEVSRSKEQREAEAQALPQVAARLAVAAKQGPAAIDAFLDTVPRGVAKRFEGLTNPEDILKVGMNPEQITTAAQKAQQQAEEARHNRAGEAFQSGELGVKQAAEQRERMIYEATYGSGANPALQGVEPKLRTAAASQAQKIGEEYINANRAADELQKVIELARSGNKAAGSNLPVLGVGALNAINGIKRFNKAELEQYEGAGSLFDRITGRAGKLIAGKPIPDDVLKDIEALHQTIAGGSAAKYTQKIDNLNLNYRSNFANKPPGAPAAPPSAPAAIPPAVQAALKGAGPGIHKLSDGTTWKVDASGVITKQ